MFFFTPILSVLISVIYFRKSPRDQPLARRYLVSAHGVVIAVIYVAAILVWQVGSAQDALARPFILICIIPVLLIVASFVWFRGPRYVHLLQLGNLFCLGATFFIGGMAVSGDWL
jgi:uncharacterized YccA/Bax inhibitor family protein